MRLSLVMSALASGLVMGWAGFAAADGAASNAAPPAAPIFYCPTPASTATVTKTAVVATPAKSKARHVAVARIHRVHVRSHVVCPTERVAHEHHHAWHGHGGEGYASVTTNDDVAKSQEFIYRYERAEGGLDPHAARLAWAHRDGGPMMQPPPPQMAPPPPMPPPPPGIADGSVQWRYHDGDRHDGDHDGDQRWADGQSVTPLPPAMSHTERRAVVIQHDGDRRDGDHDGDQRWADDKGAPPLPPVAHIDRRVVIRHDGDHDDDQRWADAHRAPPLPPLARIERDGDRHDGDGDYAFEDHGATAGGAVRYGYERRDSEHSSGWSESDVDGQRHVEHWDDGGHRAPPCPPPNDVGCTAGETYQSGDGQWHDGSYGHVYGVAGRDADGYLVWPGKTPQ